MLNPGEILQALAAKAVDFTDFQQQQRDLTATYQAQLSRLRQQNPSLLRAQLAALSMPGAIPSLELQQANDDWSVLFSENFPHHQAAQTWAAQQLAQHATFAVDGAQIMPPPGVLPPVAAIQIAQFENPHTTTGKYRKQTHWEVLTPSELRFDPYSEHLFSRQEINLRRWRLELETLQQYMLATAAARQAPPFAKKQSPSNLSNPSNHQSDPQSKGLFERQFESQFETQFDPQLETQFESQPTHHADSTSLPPVLLLDGSLIISFAERWHQDQRQAFLEPLISLLDTANATRIPLVGYVGTSYACDLLVMLRKLAGATGPNDRYDRFSSNLAISDDWAMETTTTATSTAYETPTYSTNADPNSANVYSEHFCDAYLFKHLSWGSRSIFFRCARAGILQDCQQHRDGVGFVYLKINQGLPARLEIPYWVYEQGLLDYVINIVLSEVIVGLGHPYALSVAQRAANISTTERETFYQLLRQFTASKTVPGA
jgi:NurA domain